MDIKAFPEVTSGYRTKKIVVLHGMLHLLYSRIGSDAMVSRIARTFWKKKSALWPFFMGTNQKINGTQFRVYIN